MENLCYHCGKTFETEEEADFCSQECIDIYEKCSYGNNKCSICDKDLSNYSGVEKLVHQDKHIRNQT